LTVWPNILTLVKCNRLIYTPSGVGLGRFPSGPAYRSQVSWAEAIPLQPYFLIYSSAYLYYILLYLLSYSLL
jgi:hypothetical protein